MQTTTSGIVDAHFCARCRYYSGAMSGNPYCDYYCRTGQRRPCPAGAGCTARRPMGRQPIIDPVVGQQLVQRGATEADLVARFGCAAKTAHKFMARLRASAGPQPDGDPQPDGEPQPVDIPAYLVDNGAAGFGADPTPPPAPAPEPDPLPQPDPAPEQPKQVNAGWLRDLLDALQFQGPVELSGNGPLVSATVAFAMTPDGQTDGRLTLRAEGEEVTP